MTKFDINITDQQTAMQLDRQCLRRTVEFVLNSFDIAEAAISIAVVDSEAIKKLKKEFFDMDVVTDVISFDLSEEDIAEWEIVVNAQLADELADGDRQQALAELNLYIVHGLLHQLGFDDQSPRQAEEMHKKEDQLLEELGYGKVFYRKG